MLRNYLKIAFRNLRRRKGYAFINVFGLAVGLAACLLIGLFVRDELSYGDFHEKADRIYVVAEWTERNGDRMMFGTGFNVGRTLDERFPQVEEVTRTTFSRPLPVTVDGAHFEAEGFYAGASFFDVFTFPLAKGDPETALVEPYSVVLTPNAAQKYFSTENPMEKTLLIEGRGEEALYTVTGVMEPVPSNTYLSFDVLLSGSTIDPNARTAGIYQAFALLEEPGAAELLRQVPPTQIDERLRDEAHLSIVPLTGIYLSDLTDEPGFKGDPFYLYIFSALGVLILLIAVINYTNLATARSAQRACEVGIRKTAGATRGQLARQFLGESVLLSLAALALALVLAKAALPAFNALVGKELALTDAGAAPLWLGLLGVMLVVGLVAGSYPALYLSGFEPARVLRGRLGAESGSGRLRKTLVVVQFGLSIALIIGTAVVWRQLHFMQTKDLGFNEEHVVVLPMGGDALKGRHNAVKRALLRHPNVIGAAAASTAPGDFRVRRPVRLNDSGEEKRIEVWPVTVDADYLDVLGMRLVAGRNFSEERSSDLTGAYILNEAAVDALDWTPEEAIGKSFKLSEEGRVIGVVENFHFVSPRREIAPVAFHMRKRPAFHERFGSYYNMVVRIRPGETQETLAFLEEQWNRFVVENPFAYTFLNEKFARMYESERRLSRSVGAFAGLALFLACLGLFGLAAYAAERRTKEIGIRKVLGATMPSIVVLLSRDFLKLVLAAFVLAAPVAYYVMHRWLENFAYRIDLGAGIFLLAGGAALVIALATVSYQALKAAWADPVDALRSE